MSLGDKLKKTLDELEEAKIKGLEAQANADLAKLRKDRADKETLVKRIKNQMVEQIEAGNIPLVKITSYEQQAWIHKAEKGKAEFQVLWSDLIQELGQEKLRLVVSDDHDGVGIKSWINISVIPSPQKITYRGGVRVPTSKEIRMDPHPEKDPRIVTED